MNELEQELVLNERPNRNLLEQRMVRAAVQNMEEDNQDYRLCQDLADYNTAFDNEERILPVNDHGRIKNLKHVKDYIPTRLLAQYSAVINAY